MLAGRKLKIHVFRKSANVKQYEKWYYLYEIVEVASEYVPWTIDVSIFTFKKISFIFGVKKGKGY